VKLAPAVDVVLLPVETIESSSSLAFVGVRDDPSSGVVDVVALLSKNPGNAPSRKADVRAFFKAPQIMPSLFLDCEMFIVTTGLPAAELAKAHIPTLA
jgi:hypothetical protein